MLHTQNRSPTTTCRQKAPSLEGPYVVPSDLPTRQGKIMGGPQPRVLWIGRPLRGPYNVKVYQCIA